MNWPAYRERYLPAMTLRQIEALPAKQDAYVLLSVGAIEQHGPHLPVGVDALLGQIFLDHLMPLLPQDLPVYVAPPIQVAKSNEHTGFPGSLILSRESLRRQVLAVALQLELWGFQRIGILNTHGGNASVLKSLVRELRLEHAMLADLLPLGFEPDVASPREAAFGIHAGEFEASVLYAAMPDLTDPTVANCEWIGSLENKSRLQAEFAPATYAWKTLDISKSGTMGDAKAGSAEKGRRWIEGIARGLAGIIRSKFD
ncbi:creatininase family protein [Coraliomargarita parva]|uniref:creatininase family protein n=1 Tax=Coraliomargarita parva TaxID=3014050 RepID=UPI0022B4D27B|nr:creatininase family protein [Coraliomargarita parva]